MRRGGRAARTPCGWRLAADPEQIADAVAFLASDDCRFITAEALGVDGGAQYF